MYLSVSKSLQVLVHHFICRGWGWEYWRWNNYCHIIYRRQLRFLFKVSRFVRCYWRKYCGRMWRRGWWCTWWSIRDRSITVSQSQGITAITNSSIIPWHMYRWHIRVFKSIYTISTTFLTILQDKHTLTNHIACSLVHILILRRSTCMYNVTKFEKRAHILHAKCKIICIIMQHLDQYTTSSFEN